MKRDWLLVSVLTLLTLGAALFIIRSMAPGLLGVPVDLQMVAVSEEVPPFFENVFRPEDLLSEEFIIKDPYTGVRARPLFPNWDVVGPNDLLGFRNRAVPNVADVVTIGDSQTYGNNSAIQLNWPSQMGASLNQAQDTTVYNMSVGGWGAVQYLHTAINATVFQPRVIVVAYYTGNDALESFKMAYNYEQWRELIPDPSLSASDAPSYVFPPPKSEQWPVQFSDGVNTVFTPKLRYLSNMNHPAVKAGYEIMAEVARKVVEHSRPKGVNVLFTIIPTKELVYEKKLSMEEVPLTPDYENLVRVERANIEWLKQEIRNIPNASYVDLLGVLETAALEPVGLYPSGSDGHPAVYGYQIIGQSLASAAQHLIPTKQEGLAILNLGRDQYKPIFINGDGYWTFPEPTNFDAYGWVVGEAPVIVRRDIANLDYAGVLNIKNMEEFGPVSLSVSADLRSRTAP